MTKLLDLKNINRYQTCLKKKTVLYGKYLESTLESLLHSLKVGTLWHTDKHETNYVLKEKEIEP